MQINSQFSPEALPGERVKLQIPGCTVVSGRRYYSPGHGRFLGRDPIGETGGLHLYGFCGNNAINRWDTLGMYWGLLPDGEGGNGYWGWIEGDETSETQRPTPAQPANTLDKIDLQLLGANGPSTLPGIPPSTLGTLKIRAYGDSTSPELLKQAEEQMAFLRENNTVAAQRLEATLKAGWDVIVIVGDTVKNSDILPPGWVGKTDPYKADDVAQGIKIAYITYDPRFGVAYTEQGPDGKNRTANPGGAGTLAHELGHAYDYAYKGGKTGELEQRRLENEVRALQGVPLITEYQVINRGFFPIPEYDKYVPKPQP